ncbi:AP-1 complex subunit theta-1 [Rhizoclosmatium globosum]|uniref:AP complex subunit sigma n=1 Tax=Rhizoclosmatium globosum TaxID=329046 RepID=A0A1Y2CTZ3_9FUNG|nr:hypothetical protein HDU99_008734 [Rhizoclosmatium hyalinum]KAJ3283369.1 hypothetical protein HDU79_009118 [Rhizoclosmatium sp. JEL0117]ORY50462.1 AP-1 complex subunit theta-1 [Rhizoclosmatium globosum]|eukprot:ORY50462.1 AP-1 complex subunit theta-1 [Rhizoclosmatium globosum]
MAIRFILLVSRQGKVRLAKWFTADYTTKEKQKAVKDVTQAVLARRPKMCNILEFKDYKLVYRRYASLFFIAATDQDDNELITLEIIHRYVELLDKWFLNVSELDIIFNFQQAYTILDELMISGEMQESSKRSVVNSLKRMEETEKTEIAGNLL